ncbi:unnamed protein product [Rhizophagus irregularis]|nr:unnamed protein product [Rhizophagus irregularis]
MDHCCTSGEMNFRHIQFWKNEMDFQLLLAYSILEETEWFKNTGIGYGSCNGFKVFWVLDGYGFQELSFDSPEIWNWYRLERCNVDMCVRNIVSRRYKVVRDMQKYKKLLGDFH